MTWAERSQRNLQSTQDLVPGISVQGAVIVADLARSDGHLKVGEREGWFAKIPWFTHRFSRRSVADDKAAGDLSSKRAHTAREMYRQLPFPTTEGPPVFARPCPNAAEGSPSLTYA